MNGLISGSTYALFALGFGLAYATSRFFNLAHAAVFTAAAYLAFTFRVTWGWPAVLALPLAVAGAALLGGALEAAVYRPLRRRGATDIALLLASLGSFVGLQGVLSIAFGDAPRSIRGPRMAGALEIAGARLTTTQIATMVVTGILLIAMVGLFRWTRFGRSLRAVASDPELARILGIDHERIVLGGSMLSAALAAVAAILTSYDLDITPAMGFKALLMGMVAVIMGGVGSLSGAVAGAFGLALAQHLGTAVLSAKWKDAIAFSLMLAFLLGRPRGIAGVRSRAQEV